MTHPYTTAIIAAAGLGTRMKKTPDKILEIIKGKTVIEYTIENFENAAKINDIVIVVHEKNLSEIKDIVKKRKFRKVSAVVPGSTARALSVKNGFDAVSSGCQYILIHDGARPLFSANEIDKILSKAYKTDCLICGKKVTDTIKRITSEGEIKNTVDRNSLFSAQTPQVFKYGIYKDALSRAKGKLAGYTDDASLVKAAGYSVSTYETADHNIKITTDEDLDLFTFFIEKSAEK